MDDYPPFNKLKVGPIREVFLPRKWWFVADSMLDSYDLSEALLQIPGLVEDTGQFEGQSYRVNINEFDFKSEDEMLRLLTKYRDRVEKRKRKKK